MSDAVALAKPCTTTNVTLDTALALASERESYFVARTRRLLDESQAVEVNDLLEAEMATDLAAQVKTLMKKIEDERKRLTQPMNAQVKALNTRFKTWTEPLKQAETRLKHAIYNFEKAEEQKAIAAAKARQAEADAAALEQASQLENDGRSHEAETVVDTAARTTYLPTERSGPIRGDYGGTASVVQRYDFRVTDIAALATARPDLVMPNGAKIREEMRAQQYHLSISGLEVIQVDSLSVR